MLSLKQAFQSLFINKYKTNLKQENKEVELKEDSKKFKLNSVIQ